MQTIFYFLISLLGASLLFIVQPMAAKSALPILGGAPFVWNGCMVFFQTLLLGGYLYAHLLNKSLPVRLQPLVHIPLLALALFAFPITFTGSSYVDPALEPMAWLLSMLSLSVALPFFVLSATSPLSQRWFAAAAPTRQPYTLYAASNVGSFAGLLAYPIFIEPLLPIHGQASMLFYGFGLLLALFAIVAIPHVRGQYSEVTIAKTTATPPLARQPILTWIALSFVPSSLLYGVTTYITTDIASVPLFWIIPLALYLLTFVLIFGRHTPTLDLWRTLHRMGAPAVAFLALLPLSYPAPTLVLHLLIFFAATMMCHGRLSALKPAPQQLTGFFLWVSFGGVLGGIFNSFIAPVLFTTVIEYPLMLILSLGVVAVATDRTRSTIREGGRIIAAWGLFSTLFWLLGTHIHWLQLVTPDENVTRTLLRGLFVPAGLIIIMAAYFKRKDQPLIHVAWVIPTLIIAIPLFNVVIDNQEAFIGRNVFGVSRVIYQSEKNAWLFRHGTTYHGIQSADAAQRLKPTSYYGPLLDVYKALPKPLVNKPVAVMGMGVGTVACYGHPHQTYDFFEIDPLVDLIAHDTRYFTYLRDCAPDKNIMMGDGRIGLNKSEDKRYGLIIIDVFSSDAIPMHVLTREAVAMYASKLREDGMIAFNISNRHIDLVPVLSAIANDVGLEGASKLTIVSPTAPLQMSSRWVVLAKHQQALAPLKAMSKDWQALPEANPNFLWRDDYSNILRSMQF
ncbi:MAG: fused MFS/spermidine synthase [Alphaproteobacteria bacterium]|nr:fused MFS/spermidine synthase [Alphaproteobacteria bacterium]